MIDPIRHTLYRIYQTYSLSYRLSHTYVPDAAHYVPDAAHSATSPTYMGHMYNG